MFFKLSADRKLIPINLDLVTYFGDFVTADQASLTRLSCDFSSNVKDFGAKFVKRMLKGSCYHQIRKEQ